VILQTQEYGAVTVVKPDKPLTSTDADKFKEKVLETIRKTLGRVILDVSAVSYVDSKGLEVLFDITQQLSQRGCALKLCGANETLRQVLLLTGLSSQFEHFDDANSAIRSFL
jgi:anti-anti-sigma factor